MMNNLIKIILLFFGLVVLISCEEQVQQYFTGDTEKSVDIDLISKLKQESKYSTYVSLIEEYKIDTIINNGGTFTVFVPTNDAFDALNVPYVDTLQMLNYLFTSSYVNIAGIRHNQKIQTFGEKFANIQIMGDIEYFDNVEISFEGPLCNNGKYYELENVAVPKPNLYEYIALTNPFYKNYIELQDSIALDPLSKPIGYNDNGETVYDSILITINRFERDYFPVSIELRDDRATMILFSEQQYNSSLDKIVSEMKLTSKNDIPDVWINEVMMPYMISQGIFKNELDLSELAKGRVKNIQGDSVEVDISNLDPDAFQCSNGLAYNYKNFEIPQELYMGADTIHGYDLAISNGTGGFRWIDEVEADGAQPEIQYNQKINKDVLNVDLSQTDNFYFTFKFKNIFPGEYRFLCNLKASPAGIYKILVNGEVQQIKMTEGLSTTTSDVIDLDDLKDVRNNKIKYVSNTWYRASNGYRILEVLFTNITEFGDVDVTFEYVGPSPNNMNVKGINIDYMMLEGGD